MTLSPCPEPLVAYLAEYFGSRDFFECHEIMEDYWKRTKGQPLENSWRVLIRIAVMQYHERRGNRAGARKLLAKVAGEIEPRRMDEIGFDGARLAAMLRARLAAWSAPEAERSAAYEDFELPIADPDLLRLARRACAERGWPWATPPHEVAEAVVHRHLRRDRSEVVFARRAAARERETAPGEQD